MWFYMVVGFLVLLAIFGGVLAGGIFTIVLLPLAVIVLIAAVAYSILGASAQRKGPAAGSVEDRPLPTGQQDAAGRVRTTPERLADARRVQQ